MPIQYFSDLFLKKKFPISMLELIFLPKTWTFSPSPLLGVVIKGTWHEIGFRGVPLYGIFCSTLPRCHGKVCEDTQLTHLRVVLIWHEKLNNYLALLLWIILIISCFSQFRWRICIQNPIWMWAHGIEIGCVYHQRTNWLVHSMFSVFWNEKLAVVH